MATLLKQKVRFVSRPYRRRIGLIPMTFNKIVSYLKEKGVRIIGIPNDVVG